MNPEMRSIVGKWGWTRFHASKGVGCVLHVRSFFECPRLLAKVPVDGGVFCSNLPFVNIDA